MHILRTFLGLAFAGAISASAFGQTYTNPAYLTPGTTTPRTVGARQGEVFNVRDFGALGTGASTAIGTTYGASLAALAAYTVNGATPFSWATNPAYGLTFSISASVAQTTAGTTLTFLNTMNNYNGWVASVAAWQDPANYNFNVRPGMLVSGPCIAGGTTVSAVGRTPGAGYGTITLSQASSSACAAAASITFTVSPAQLQASTVDWLAIQTAMANAAAAPGGGRVSIPSGTYMISRPLVNAASTTDTAALLPAMEFVGAGQDNTSLFATSDFGQDTCLLTEASRTTFGISTTYYHDFRMKGVQQARVLGASPNAMDGLCIGTRARVSDINVQFFHAGLQTVKDHWTVRQATFSNNGYGIYFGPYGATIGNDVLDTLDLTGNTIAGVGTTNTNQIDAATWSTVHTGYSPYGIYYEATTPNVSTPLTAIFTNSTLRDVFIEQIGNSWLFGAGKTGTVIGNTIIGGGFSDVGNAANQRIAANPVPAVIYVQTFEANTMIGTSWGSFGTVTEAIISTSGYADVNQWIGDRAFVNNSTATIGQMRCGGECLQNTFQLGSINGAFRLASANVTSGTPVSASVNNQVRPYVEGTPFIGIASATFNAGVIGPVVTDAELYGSGGGGNFFGGVKAVPTQAITAGQPVFVAAGGFVGGMSADGAIGTAAYASSPTQNFVALNLFQGQRSGGESVANELTAAGTTQATAYTLIAAVNRFTTVAAGSGAILGLAPIGQSVTIYNDGANALLVYPQAGAAIGTGATNAGLSLAAGATGTYRRLTATTWR